MWDHRIRLLGRPRDVMWIDGVTLEVITREHIPDAPPTPEPVRYHVLRCSLTDESCEHARTFDVAGDLWAPVEFVTGAPQDIS